MEVTGADPGLEYMVRVAPVNGEGEAGQATTLNADFRSEFILYCCAILKCAALC